MEKGGPSCRGGMWWRGNLYDCISANYIDLSLKLILRLMAMGSEGRGFKKPL